MKFLNSLIVLIFSSLFGTSFPNTLEDTNSPEILPNLSGWNFQSPAKYYGEGDNKNTSILISDDTKQQLEVLELDDLKKEDNGFVFNDLDNKLKALQHMNKIKYEHPHHHPHPQENHRPSVCSEVATLNGLVRGTEIRTPTRKRVCVFYGIPFAEPPIGNLRFAKPVPIGNWVGTLDATKFPDACTQIPSNFFNGFIGEAMWNPNANISENCLYLNIWVPVDVLQNAGNDNETIPILYWIFGGGLTSGTSTLPAYDGSILSGDNGVLVASANYRLGPLGSLFFGREYKDLVPGNINMLDQNLALQWINKNAGNFGGNPDQITLFGESTGAFSISYHLLSPMSIPWFNRGILMSGAAPKQYLSPSKAIEYSYAVAKGVGCWSGTTYYDTENISQIIDCMRKLEAIEFMTLQIQVPGVSQPGTGWVTADGDFLTENPENLLNSPAGKRADIIIGNVKDEGTYSLVYSLPKYFGQNTTVKLSYDKFLDAMSQIFADFPPDQKDLIISRYTNWENLDDADENLRRVISAQGDYYFTCPDVAYAKKWAARGLRVYYYFFTQRSSSSPWGKWMGVMHADDIEYVFGGPLTNSSRPKGEKDLSRNIQRLFTSFAKTGVPANTWETYTSAYPVFLDMNATIISNKTTSNIFGPHAEVCTIWNHDLPLFQQRCSNNTQSHHNNYEHNLHNQLENSHNEIYGLERKIPQSSSPLNVNSFKTVDQSQAKIPTASIDKEIRMTNLNSNFTFKPMRFYTFPK